MRKHLLIAASAVLIFLIILGISNNSLPNYSWFSYGGSHGGNISTKTSQTSTSSGTTSSSGCSFNGLAICIINQLPLGANYPVGSWYPGGTRFVRMRMVQGQGWSSPGLNAQQALLMITQMKPQVLERMTDWPINSGVLNQQVPVCSGCSSMTYAQFLDSATIDCGCYITPRLSLDSVKNGIAPPNFVWNDCSQPAYSNYFECEAYNLYNSPITPHLEMLSVDNWWGDCTSGNSAYNCNSCSWDASVFAPLYAMGWKSVTTLNGGGYVSSCGWTPYVTFDSGAGVTTETLSAIQNDPTVLRIFMYDPDFPGPAQNLQATCTSSSIPGNIITYRGCGQLAQQVTMAAKNQADGYTYVYTIEQTFWDTTQMFLSNGTSIYTVMLNLMNRYN